METPEECTIFLLAKAYQRGHAALKKRLVPYGLTPLQQLIMAALALEDGISAGEVGKRLTLDSATLSGILDRMEEKGLIEKRSDPTDKRVSRIHLTSSAREMNSGLAHARQEANQELLAKLSLEEKLLLKRILKDLAN